MQEIQTTLLPFDAHQRRVNTVPEGLKLQQIVDLMIPPGMDGHAYVTINGELIPTNVWDSLTPKRASIVGVHVVATGGGGGGGKNPLATVVSLVTLVAAPYLAGAFGSSLALGIFGGGVATAGQVAFAQGLIRVAVGVAGFLAKSALSNTPSQSLPQNSNNIGAGSNVRESPTQFIEGASNSLLQWGVIPICLGVNRMFPPQAALPYTETESDDQFVRQLFTWGYGEVSISDEKIGETDLASFSDVETFDRLNGDLDSGTSLYSDTVFQEELSILLNEVDGYSTRTTQENTDEIVVDITFIQGLVSFSNNGGRNSRSVDFDIEYSPTGAGTWTAESFTITDNRTSAIRRSFRFSPGSSGQWDVRIRRTTTDSTSDRIRDDMTWTALKSVEFTNPINQDNVSGTAMRIKATDQLNGSVDRYNAIVSAQILDYDDSSGTWIKRVTSNPASIYRYVLQSPAFVKNLPDSRLNLTKLQEWHTYCESLGLEFNRIIDFETNVETVLNDVAAAGFATKSNVDGIYSVIIDNTRDVVKGIVTPKNSWGYKGGISYPEIPHALIVEFRNPDRGYAVDERIIYSPTYDESNATLYERIEFASCTDSDLAYIYGRRYLANMRLQPETHTFYQDPEFLTLNRGDRFTFINDVILVGVGSGRISSLTYDDAMSPTEVTGFVLNDEVTIPSTNNFAVRIRHSDASDIPYYPLTTVVGTTSTFMFTTPITLTGYVAETDDYLQERQLLDALCSFVEDGKELDLLVLSAESDKDHNAKIRAINYAPERFNLDADPIPTFNSNVTTPLGLYAPFPPLIVGQPLSDADVMIRNSDGSYLTRMIINLNNRNEKDVRTLVRAKASGNSQYFTPEIISSSPEEIVLTGLEDGKFYDFEIRYQRLDGQGLISVPLVLNSTQHIGASQIPADVSNFVISVISDTAATLSWDANPDLDISHYEVRYSPAFTGSSWESSQVVEEMVMETRLAIPFRAGTYHVKAVDFLGNESENETSVVTINQGQIRNVVEELVEQTAFLGTKTNVEISSDALILTDLSLDGYYEFNDTVDLTEVQNSYITANIEVGGVNVAGTDTYDLFTADNDIFLIEDMFGVGVGGWRIEIQGRFTDDDPSGSPTWTDWELLRAGFYEFRGAQFRILLQSLQENISPSVSTLEITIDMPDRIERGEGLTVPALGTTITYDSAFQNNPAVNITLQDGESDDKIEYTSKTSSGFTFRVYNETTAGYVSRTYDYVSSGYGRI